MAWSRLKEEEEEEARSIHTHLSSQLVWMDRRRGKEREGRGEGIRSKGGREREREGGREGGERGGEGGRREREGGRRGGERDDH